MHARAAALAAALLLALPAAAQPLPRVITPDSAILASSGYSQDQLAAMLAPIALYPDPLLAQMLMASTHPDELAAANAWRAEPANQGLEGADLAAAAPNWDQAVRSLLPFPAQLASLATHPDWTAGLAWAYANQQPDLLDTVQHLREQAMRAGTLTSGPALSVRTEPPPGDDGTAQPLILIQPADPGLVMVPLYDPLLAFGVWSSPAYPPMRLAQPGWNGAPGFNAPGLNAPGLNAPGLNPGYGFGLSAPMGFGPAVAVGGLAGGLWGLAQPVWGGPGWRGPGWHGPGWQGQGGFAPHIARDPDRWNRLTASPVGAGIAPPPAAFPQVNTPPPMPQNFARPNFARPTFARPTFAQPPPTHRFVPDYNGQFRREQPANARPVQAAPRPAFRPAEPRASSPNDHPRGP